MKLGCTYDVPPRETKRKTYHMKLNSLKDAVSLKSPINIMVIVLSISLISEILYAIHTKVIHASGVSLVPTTLYLIVYIMVLC